MPFGIAGASPAAPTKLGVTMIEIHLTDQAKAFSSPNTDTLAARVIDDFFSFFRKEDEETPETYKWENLVMHTSEIDGHEYIMTFEKDHLQIDICNRIMSKVLDSGPFKGKKVSIPDVF